MRFLLTGLLLLAACTAPSPRTIVLTDNSAAINTAYGEVFIHNDTGVTQSVIIGTYNNISHWSVGHTRNVNANDTYLIPLRGGEYKLNWALSFGGGGNQEYQLTVLINGVKNEDCETHRVLGTGGDVGSASSTCIISVNASDLISLGIEDEDTPVTDASIFTGNMNIVRLNT